ncbi:triose-phosphate isomerase [Acuticoccus sp.]|uniref:triose-phosphate isomerase n=1 Tax=Acuticoccus sp. TaxID=1904378 RepID=UPI003B51F389
MLIAGNWKMNGMPDAMDELGRMIARAPEVMSRGVDLLVCPPAVLIARFAERATVSKLRIGAQDCHPEEKGAHTGDISAAMLAACGATAVIVGHSERRADHGETDELVARKAAAAQRAGLDASRVRGRERGPARRGGGGGRGAPPARRLGAGVLDAGRLVVAYEPVWAIGTGRTPSPRDVAAMHGAIRDALDARFAATVPILYGGSVKPDNAAELLAVDDVDGALVGGASLKADDFLAIALAAPSS